MYTLDDAIDSINFLDFIMVLWSFRRMPLFLGDMLKYICEVLKKQKVSFLNFAVDYLKQK